MNDNKGIAAMNPLSLAAGVLPEFPPEKVAQAGAAAGYSWVGFTIDPSDWSNLRTQRLRSLVADLELSVLDVEVIWIPEGGVLSDADRRIVEVGAELGARNVLAVSREPDTGRAAEALNQLCVWAEPAGMRVCLEFLMIAQVQTFSAAHAIVQACDHPAAGILIDPLHLQRAGEGVEVLAAAEPQLFPYAQFCDGNVACEASFEAYLEDALDLRSAAGEGELPLRTLLQHLPPECPLSLEVRSRYYRETYVDPAERAAAILRQTRSALEHL